MIIEINDEIYIFKFDKHIQPLTTLFHGVLGYF